jgi:Uma2 family endonuclease
MTATMPERLQLPRSLPSLAKSVAAPKTAQEYDALPPTSRVELVDGVLRVMTPPTRRHQEIVENLKTWLCRLRPASLRIVREQEIRIAGPQRRNPDLMAVLASADGLDVNGYWPEDVLLAVEVVSPGSKTRDRIHKPGEYAEAGVPHYWRVETSPWLAVHTYQLDAAGQYRLTGVFEEGERITAAGLDWIDIAVDDLRPDLGR